MKEKRFGQVFAFEYRSGKSALLPGVSVCMDQDERFDDPCLGEWMRLAEAKRLIKDLQKAVKYAERNNKRKGIS